MKHFLTLLLVLTFFSCKKKETCTDGIKNQEEVNIDCGSECTPCPIEYPETGTYGINILHGNDTLRISGSESSFRAITPEGSSLRIEMYLVNGDANNDSWGTGKGTSVNWSFANYSNYAGGSQFFDVLNPGTSELRVLLPSSSTDVSILIKYFENSTSETKRKILIVE